MQSRYSNLFRFFFVCADLLVLNLVYLVLLNWGYHIADGANSKYIVLFIVANMLWLLSAYWTALYIEQPNNVYEMFLKRTVRCLFVFFILMVFFVFFYHFSFSRMFILLSMGVFSTLILTGRLLMLFVSWAGIRIGKESKRVVIIGYNDVARRLAQSFSQQKRNTLVEGYFEDPRRVDELSLLPIIGNIDDCISYAVKNKVNEIYSTISPEMNTSIYEMAHIAERSLIRFKFVPDFKFYVNRNVHMEYMNDFPVLSLRPEPLEDATNAIKKRIFDIVFSLLVIIFLLSWLTPILAILIKLNSRGPVFFVQPRSGKDNKQFNCFKFRTLAVNREAHSRQVTRGDSRITKLGRLLRKTNLDELPQFLNVLLGDMSVVGPRPHMLAHTESFSKLQEQYMVRHFVKPGVTGWAQVNGYRGEIKVEEELHRRIEHDIWYLENWSIWLDMRIIFLTVYNTIKGEKNAF